jgi:hypothetical protein
MARPAASSLAELTLEPVESCCMAALWALAFTVMAFWAFRALTLVLITAGIFVLQKIK